MITPHTIYEKWGGGGGGGGGGQSTSDPIYEKWERGGGGGGGGAIRFRYDTKSGGGAIRFRSDTESGEGGGRYFVWHKEDTLSLIINGYSFDQGGCSSTSHARANELKVGVAV